AGAHGDADAAGAEVEAEDPAHLLDARGPPRLVEGLVELGGVAASGHRDVGLLATTATADRLRGVGDECRSLEAAVLRDCGNQSDAAALGHTAEDDALDLGTIADGDGQVLQFVARGAVAAGDDDAVDGFARQVLGGVARRGAPQGLELVVETAPLFEESFDALREL